MLGLGPQPARADPGARPTNRGLRTLRLSPVGPQAERALGNANLGRLAGQAPQRELARFVLALNMTGNRDRAAVARLARPEMTRPTLRAGSREEAVGECQALLNTHGATPPLQVDRAFGPLTTAAVREFQGIHGLSIDGVVGAETWGALDAQPPSGRAQAPPAESSKPTSVFGAWKMGGGPKAPHKCQPEMKNCFPEKYRGCGRELHLQPVFFADEPRPKAIWPFGSMFVPDTHPTSADAIFNVRVEEAKTAWGKLGVRIGVKEAKTVESKYKTSDATNKDEIRKTHIPSDPHEVPVYVLDNPLEPGGALTLGRGQSDHPYTLLSNGGTSTTLLAHEVGHALGLGHPEEYPKDHAADKSIMVPTNDRNASNPDRVPWALYPHLGMWWDGAWEKWPVCLRPDP